MALGDAKSGRDVDPTLRPDLRLAFQRPGCQTHGVHRTQGIIFADVHPSHTLKSYAQTVHPNHTPKSYAQNIHPNHINKPYTQIIRSNHTPRPYAQTIRPGHTPKPYAQIITTVVLLSYCVQSSHSEMVRLKKECIYSNKSSIKGNYAKLDVTRRFELAV